MTQPALLKLEPLPPIYIVDACSIMELDNAHRRLPNQPPRPPNFSPEEREAIWQGLEELAAERRLKLLDKIATDLRNNHEAGLARLSQLVGIKMRTTRAVERIYREVLRRNPAEMTYLMRKPRKASDVYLVAAANYRGYYVITEEDKNADGVPIPKMCRSMVVPCGKIRDIALAEGWII